jgi:23S rRNA pseudouridine1911/1915/1917 synthase
LNKKGFVVVSKPATLPTQADQTGDPDLLALLAQKSDQFSVLHVIHRLDRVASGVVLLGKDKKNAASLSQQFQNRKIEKKYLAWVSNEPKTETGTLTHFMKKNTNKKAICQHEPEAGFDIAVLHYRVVGKSDRYVLLEIDLETGRFHQIRAQLAAIGCHIKGDVKYGARRANLDRSIHLHAWKLTFLAPQNSDKIVVEAPFPAEPLWELAKNLLNSPPPVSNP